MIKFGKVFQRVAPILIGDLVREFKLTPEQAAGFPGNFGPESGLVSGQQEGKPIGVTGPARGPRGGVDWAQWTGDRRVAFAEFIEERELPYPSYEASWEYLKHELYTSHAYVIDRVRKTRTAKTSAETVGYHFEKFRGYEQIDGNENYENRVKHAEAALALYKASNPPPIDEPIEATLADKMIAVIEQNTSTNIEFKNAFAALTRTISDLTVQVAKMESKL